MPRFSIRKLILYIIFVCSGLIFIIHQRTQQQMTSEEVIFSGIGIASVSRGANSTERAFAPKAFLSVKKPLKKPWYMKNGEALPLQEQAALAKLYPEESPHEDRIPEQLMFTPNLKNAEERKGRKKFKKILLWNGVNYWGARPGKWAFTKENCPVNDCLLSSARTDFETADLVIFKDHFVMPSFTRPRDQLWMMYMLECPLHTQTFRQADVFNWTSTYRRDSTLVAPYERWQYYDDSVRVKTTNRNYAANKTKAVAWFVSNCGARNGRLQYANELQKHIQVDIYGFCGTKQCPRSDAENCFKMLDRDYKFYLAFENSNCKDYITEKFFVNGLGHDVIPIVMGARPEDYEVSSPYKSYIHVDNFDGPKELAEYLHKLDKNDDLYNEYFQWKGTGEFINTKFFCRVCSLLHSPKAKTREASVASYKDINEWWRGRGTCITGSWKKFDKALKAQKEKNTIQEKLSRTNSSATTSG